MTEQEVRKILRKAVAAAGSQVQWARGADISQPYLHDVLAGRRPLPEKVLARLGIERIVTVTYRPKRTER